MTCEAAGTASSVLCPAIWASTEVATASAAERAELSPLGAAEAELCWMTGAGEPEGSELSLGLSVRHRQRERDSTQLGTGGGSRT